MQLLAAFLCATMLAAPAPQGRVPPEATVDGILGVTVGMPLDEARARLAPFGRPESRPTREGGTKEVWRLDRTGFAWIAFKVDVEGRLSWVTGHRRPGAEMLFDELSSARPATDTGAMAIWYVEGPRGGIRVSARGRDRRAQVISLIRES